MKLISWNVNGLRAVMSKDTLLPFIAAEDPDIMAFQETKMQEEQMEFNFDGYLRYMNSAEKKGYSGTMVLTKKKPLNVIYDIEGEDHPKEGRVITLEYEDFFFVCAYVPNSKDGLKRIDYRMHWEDDLRAHLMKLDKSKPVIYTGDLNVAHNEIDLKNPDDNHFSAGFSDEERGKFNELLAAGFADSFRELYPDIHINIVEQNSMALEEMLLSGEIDIALIVLPASDKRIDPEFLIRDEICLITGKNHHVLEYASEKEHSDSDIRLSIDIRDTAPFEYYLSDYDTILGREARRIFARNELIPKAYNEKMTALFAAAMAAEGQGLAFTYYSSRHYFSNAEFISIKNENPFIELAVALSPGRYHSNAALALKDVIFEVFGDQNARPKASSKASRS